MPQVDINASVVVKEIAKDENPTGEIGVSFKDTNVDDYNGPIRLKVPKGETKVINVDHLTNLRLVAIKRLSGDYFRLSLRKTTSENTDLQVERLFFAELSNVEQIKLTASPKMDLEVQVELVSLKQG